jgi:isoleucyl-tRNA synthetase
MPFAAQGYPHASPDTFTDQYPADFICEAIDQTRGWFYTLMAIGTLVFDQSSYRNVVCLGHILDEDGRKMSKHLGNVLEPIPLMDEHGADAVRWFMLASGSPWQARRVGHQAIADVVRKTLLTYWNTVAFLSLYARTAQWSPEQPAPDERPVMDRWLLAAAYDMAAEVDNSLENFDTQRAGRAIATFIDDLSNWYVRRTRRRFWDGDPAALATLHEAIRVVTLCIAPFTPFIAERVWQDLFSSTDQRDTPSVHLATWPSNSDVINPALLADMALTRRVVELGRAARASSSVRTRQPLGRALIAAAGWDSLDADLKAQVADELNVQHCDSLTDAAPELVDVAVKANFRSLGQRFGKQTPLIAAAISQTDASQIVQHLRNQDSYHLHVDDVGDITITTDDVVITETPREGWSVAAEHGESVALDLTLTDELIRAGLAREYIRAIQEARKQGGLDITDRIAVTWASDDAEAIAALNEHRDAIANDILAIDWPESLDGPRLTASVDPVMSFEFQRIDPTAPTAP